MQELERVEAQELNTTEEKTDVYIDSIHESIANYCIDHDIEIKDIYTFDQQRWNSVLLYIYKQVFKPCKKDGVTRSFKGNRLVVNDIYEILFINPVGIYSDDEFFANCILDLTDGKCSEAVNSFIEQRIHCNYFLFTEVDELIRLLRG